MDPEELIKEIRKYLDAEGKTLQVWYGTEYGGCQSVILDRIDWIRVVDK